jgi:Glycosyl transferase family 11
MRKVIVRIRGGLGNQLFCYATARQVAHKNHAELVVDASTGFIRDYQYRRTYSLDAFRIKARLATNAEMLRPGERLRRALMKLFARRRPFHARSYVEQDGINFDQRMLGTFSRESVWLDGLWQSEQYFTEIATELRNEFSLKQPPKSLQCISNSDLERENCVAMHIRWYGLKKRDENDLDSAYYLKAIDAVKKTIKKPAWILFTDNVHGTRDIDWVRRLEGVIYASAAPGSTPAADMWRMSRCPSIVMANSTFSWWAAWLRDPRKEKLTICPEIMIDCSRGKTPWNFPGQIPARWKGALG